MVLESINPIDLSSNTGFSYYKNIAKSKKMNRKKILYGELDKNNKIQNSAIYNIVENRYNEYELNKNTLENLVTSSYSEAEKEALQHCYSTKTGALETLKSTILNSQTQYYQNKCAYCGIGPIDSMDHFVPKEKFPEYSVHPFNLIPSCSICNTKKSDKFLNSDRGRIFFNPYFDIVEDKVLNLTMKAIPNKKRLSFTVKPDENFIFLQHITILEIAKRYEIEAINIFDNMRVQIVTSFESYSTAYKDINDYNKSFKKQIKKNRDIYLEEQGKNSIAFLVYDSFYGSPYCDIVSFIENYGNESSKKLLQEFILNKESGISSYYLSTKAI